MGNSPSDFNDKAKGKGGLVAVKSQIQACANAAKGTPYPPFIVKTTGVFHLSAKPGEDGEPEEKSFCSYLMPVGMVNNAKRNDCALILEMKDPDGRRKRIIIRMVETQAKGGETARVIFVGNGGTFSPGVRSKVLFNDFMNSIMRASKNLPHIISAPLSGWVRVDRVNRYVLPGHGSTSKQKGGRHGHGN